MRGTALYSALHLMVTTSLDLGLQALPFASGTPKHGSCWKALLDHTLCHLPSPQPYIPKEQSSPCQ